MDVILVDENDEQIGTMEKIEAHPKALLHKGFQHFLFSTEKGEILLQKRANKNIIAGLWANACCSHPKPGEQALPAAESACTRKWGLILHLQKLSILFIKHLFDNGLTEYEFDHVFVGNYDGDIFPDAEEVSDYCYKSVEEIKNSIQTHPQKYTEWFKIAFPKMEEYLVKNAI